MCQKFPYGDNWDLVKGHTVLTLTVKIVPTDPLPTGKREAESKKCLVYLQYQTNLQ